MAGPYTMSQLTTPSDVHTGIQVAAGVITISGTTTAAAVIYLCQVPDGATLIDWVLHINDTDRLLGAANAKVVIGTSATLSGLGAFSLSGSASSDPVYSTGRFAPRGDVDLMPARISLSDSIAGQSVWLTAKLEVAPSTSNSVLIARFHVLYTMDGMVGHNTIR